MADHSSFVMPGASVFFTGETFSCGKEEREMAERGIKIRFPEAKMEALEFFLKENDTTVEKVLKGASG